MSLPLACVDMDQAWLLEGQLTLKNGTQSPYSLKAWKSVATGRMRWELRRLLIACGYQSTSKHTSCCAHVREQQDYWKGALSAWGVDVDEHFSRSRHALSLRGDISAANEGDTEQEYWVSTIGVFVLLVFWQSYRKTAQCKDLCMLMCNMVANRCADPATCSTLVSQPPGEAIQSRCDRQVSNGCCSCMTKLLQERPWDMPTASPQEQLVALLRVLNDARHCLACVGWLTKLSCVIAEHIDQRAEQWGNRNLLKSEGIWIEGTTGAKRRRADAHMKYQAVMAGATHTSAVARQHGLANTSVALRWEEEALSQLRSTSILAASASSRGVVSSCLDAARIGRPAQDFLIHLLWDHTIGATIVAPPQAPRVCRGGGGLPSADSGVFPSLPLGCALWRSLGLPTRPDPTRLDWARPAMFPLFGKTGFPEKTVKNPTVPRK